MDIRKFKKEQEAKGIEGRFKSRAEGMKLTNLKESIIKRMKAGEDYKREKGEEFTTLRSIGKHLGKKYNRNMNS